MSQHWTDILEEQRRNSKIRPKTDKILTTPEKREVKGNKQD